MDIDGAIYSWRYYGSWVEIRVPGKMNLKWLVPIWQLQGLPSQLAWEELWKDSDGDIPRAYAVQPSMVRQYIDDMRQATSLKQESICGGKK